MQPRSDLFGVALMIQGQEPRQHRTAGDFADGVAETLLGFVEVMGKFFRGSGLSLGKSLLTGKSSSKIFVSIANGYSSWQTKYLTMRQGSD